MARTTLGIHRGVGSLGGKTVRASPRASLGMTSTNDGGAGPSEDIARQIADSVVAELSVKERGDK